MLRLFCLCLSVFASQFAMHAHAQKPVNTTAPFAVIEAADCAAAFGWMLQYLAPNGMPEEAAAQADIAFLIWGYELDRAKPDATTEDRNKHAQDAVARLNAALPLIEDEASAEAAIDVVVARAAGCADKIKLAYPSGEHPVITALEAEYEAAQKSAKSKMPLTSESLPLK